MHSKGFLGPIGDDLPSLIPLVTALMVFFGAYGLMYKNYFEKNAAIDAILRTNQLSTQLRGTSYISNPEEFEKACLVARELAGLKFHAGIVQLPNALNPVFCSDDPVCPPGRSCAPIGPDCPQIVFSRFSDLENQFWSAPRSDNGELMVFECCNVDPDSAQCRSPGLSLGQKWPFVETGQMPLVRFFPVAVEHSSNDRFFVQPAQLVVVTWR